MIKTGFTLAEMAEPRQHIRHSYKGFTLAEVLITLAIIGVVAAMTIPTLVANYQTKSWNTAAHVFEIKLEEALRVMNTQQTLAGYKNTEDFVNELAKHFKITKICQNDDLMSCFEDEVNWSVIDITSNTNSDNHIDISNLKTAADMGQNDWGTDTVGVQFANCTTGLIAYNPECVQNPYSNQVNGTGCLAIVYDTSGFKSPNTLGKDLRSINANLGDCAFKIQGTCYGTPFYPQALPYDQCEAEKADLNMQKCFSGENFWGGAVKACGGVDKVISRQHIDNDLIKYLYNLSESSSEAMDNLTLDKEKAQSMGFFGDSNIIWSGEEYTGDSYGAYAREFNTNSVNSGGYYGSSDSRVKTICVAN